MEQFQELRLLLLAAVLLSNLTSCLVTSRPNRTLGADQYGHAGSGILLPERLGAFERSKLHRADEAGLDLGADYTRMHPVDRINATIMVYPARPLRSFGSSANQNRVSRRILLEQSFEEIKRDIFEAHPGAELVREAGSTAVLFGTERDVRMANFVFSERVGPLDVNFVSTASLIALDQWLVLTRITAPDDCMARSQAERSNFAQAFAQVNEGRLAPENADLR